jgi:hypothetical protein
MTEAPPPEVSKTAAALIDYLQWRDAEGLNGEASKP